MKLPRNLHVVNAWISRGIRNLSRFLCTVDPVLQDVLPAGDSLNSLLYPCFKLSIILQRSTLLLILYFPTRSIYYVFVGVYNIQENINM